MSRVGFFALTICRAPRVQLASNEALTSTAGKTHQGAQTSIGKRTSRGANLHPSTVCARCESPSLSRLSCARATLHFAAELVHEPVRPERPTGPARAPRKTHICSSATTTKKEKMAAAVETELDLCRVQSEPLARRSRRLRDEWRLRRHRDVPRHDAQQLRRPARADLDVRAYAPMAESKMRDMLREARPGLPRVKSACALHRVGEVKIGEASVILAFASPHRKDALNACAWAIDELKRVVPVWPPSPPTMVRPGRRTAWDPAGLARDIRRRPRRAAAVRMPPSAGDNTAVRKRPHAATGTTAKRPAVRGFGEGGAPTRWAPAAPAARHQHAPPGTRCARRPAPPPRRARRTSRPNARVFRRTRLGAAVARAWAPRSAAATARAPRARRIAAASRASAAVAALRRQAGVNGPPLRIDGPPPRSRAARRAPRRDTPRATRRRGALVQMKPVEGARGGAVRVERARD